MILKIIELWSTGSQHIFLSIFVADCVIRLFIAFGEWLKLNFNVLSGNFISLLSVDIERHGRNESCWPKWPENINWPNGPIFAQFDWPDRKYSGHRPAVTSTPDISPRGVWQITIFHQKKLNNPFPLFEIMCFLQIRLHLISCFLSPLLYIK